MSDSPCKRASQAQALEVTRNVSIVLVNMCEEQTCLFIIKQVKNCTGIGRTDSWINGDTCSTVRGSRRIRSRRDYSSGLLKSRSNTLRGRRSFVVLQSKQHENRSN